MKKSLLLLVALACTGAVAQEKQVWACQQEAGTQLRWEEDRWKIFSVTDTQLLLTIDGTNSSYKEGDEEIELVCSEEFEAFPNLSITSCANNLEAEQILIDSNSGRMGKSYLFGALIRLDSVTLSAAAQVFNCTKF